MIKRVNAGLTSKSELYKRLFDGEVFYTELGGKLYYDELYITRGETPFRLGESYLAGIATRYALLLSEVDVEWYDVITKPVLCWVSDSSSNRNTYSTLITSYNKGANLPFKAGVYNWKYATPVTPEDLLQ